MQHGLRDVLGKHVDLGRVALTVVLLELVRRNSACLGRVAADRRETGALDRPLRFRAPRSDQETIMPSSPSRRRGVAPTALLLLALLLLAGAPAGARADGIFVADCKFSHRSADDPIVLHAMPGASHSHDFFGNGSTDASSTLRSLRRSAGNCVPADDRSAYWAPTLYRNGRAVRAIQVQAYYQDFFRYGHVLPFPSGLRMVAGRATATRPQRGIVRWTCKDDQGAGSATIPSCGTKPVTLRVSFPDCWDGRRLDSPDHRSHMAYNSAGGKEMVRSAARRATRSSCRRCSSTSSIRSMAATA